MVITNVPIKVLGIEIVNNEISCTGVDQALTKIFE